MKKLSYLLLIAIFNSPVCYSQEKENKSTKTFMLGFNAGGHYSFLGGDGAFGAFYNENKYNYMFGVNAELKMDKDWSLYTNLNYKPKHFANESTVLGPNGPINSEIEFRFSYLEMPVMAKYRIPNSFFYANGGIYLAKLLSLDFYENGKDTGENWIGDFNKVDMGLVVGAGFVFYENQKETTNLSLEIRYSHGLRNISTQDGNGNNVMNAYSLQLNYNFTP
ncbi:porin family protein [Flavobacterium sp.]